MKPEETHMHAMCMLIYIKLFPSYFLPHNPRVKYIIPIYPPHPSPSLTQLQQFSTQLFLNAGLTPFSSKNTSQNAPHNPSATPISFPSTVTFTPSSVEQSNCNTVPGVAAPLLAHPSNINFLSVSTSPLSAAAARGRTPSAIADAIFSAPTLKFILRRKVVCTSVDWREVRRVERAVDLGMEARLDFTVGEEYIPTEYTLIGPFFLTPTPNNGRPPRSSSNLILVAESINAAAASVVGNAPRAMVTIAKPMAAILLERTMLRSVVYFF
mmetsp:Transcript_35598/g.76845  ORF Transcript_35598/g.76845 Transcript_35598/m.76845 type:complete len:268 (-) Transcript_35598:12-815(-)